jgi:hypothetical protein
VDRIPLIEFILHVIKVAWEWVALFYLKISFAPFLGSLIVVDAFCGAAWLMYVRSLTPLSADIPPWPREWGAWSLRAYFPLVLYSGMRRAWMPCF